MPHSDFPAGSVEAGLDGLTGGHPLPMRDVVSGKVGGQRVEHGLVGGKLGVEAVGFVLAGASPDADGFVTYVYQLGSR